MLRYVDIRDCLVLSEIMLTQAKSNMVKIIITIFIWNCIATRSFVLKEICIEVNDHHIIFQPNQTGFLM